MRQLLALNEMGVLQSRILLTPPMLFASARGRLVAMHLVTCLNSYAISKPSGNNYPTRTLPRRCELVHLEIWCALELHTLQQ